MYNHNILFYFGLIFSQKSTLKMDLGTQVSSLYEVLLYLVSQTEGPYERIVTLTRRNRSVKFL